MVRTERDRAQKLRLGSRPIPLEIQLYESQRCVRLGQRCVQLKRLGGVTPCLRKCLGRREIAERAQDRIGVREARMGGGKLWVDRRRRVEIFRSPASIRLPISGSIHDDPADRRDTHPRFPSVAARPAGPAGRTAEFSARAEDLAGCESADEPIRTHPLVHGAPDLGVTRDVNQIDLYSQAAVLLRDAAVTTAATSSSRPASFGLTADPL